MRIQKTPFGKNTFRRIVAAFTTAIFLLTSIPDHAAQAFAASTDNIQVRGGTLPQDPSRLIRDGEILIPPGLGTIDEIYTATSHKATRPHETDGQNSAMWRVADGHVAQAQSAAKTIVFLQDAHDSLEAQENIAKIINHLVVSYGVKTVFEEGYEGPVPTDRYFDAIQDPAIKEKISYFLMDHLRLGGAEYAHINRTTRNAQRTANNGNTSEVGRSRSSEVDEAQSTQDEFGTAHIERSGKKSLSVARSPLPATDFQLIGADSLKLHRENIDQYRLSSSRKEAITKDLKALDRELKSLVAGRFPKELKDWLKIKAQFDAKKLDLFTYISRTILLIGTRDSELGSRGNEDPKRIPSGESLVPLLGFIVEAVHSDDPAVIEKAKHIDAREVFGELAKLDQEIKNVYLRDAADKQLFEYCGVLSLLNRLNALEVSQEEYATVKKDLREFDTQSFAQFIFDQAPKTLILSRMWERNIKDAIKFYEIAQQRDRSLSNVLDQYFVAGTTDPRLETSDKKSPHLSSPSGRGIEGEGKNLQSPVSGLQSSKTRTDVSVLVFGGFHKENIKRILESKGINYVVVSPRITKPSPRHEGFYKRLMTDGRLPYELPGLLSATATRAESRLEVWETNAALARAEIRVMEDIARQKPGLDPASYGLAVEKALKNFTSGSPSPGLDQVKKRRLNGDADKGAAGLLGKIQEAILALDAVGSDLSAGAITADQTRKTKDILREIFGREMTGGLFYDMVHKAYKDQGGWFGALKVAGLDIQDARFRPVQSGEGLRKISDAMKALAAAGVGLGAGAIMRDKTQKTRAILREIFGFELTPATFYNKAHHVFRNHGGWDGALRAAGFDPNGIRRTFFWSREEIKKIPQAIKALFRAGVDLNPPAIAKDKTERTKEILEKVFGRSMTGAALYKKAGKIFRNQNGWIGALRSAGLDPKEVRQKVLPGAEETGARSEVRTNVARNWSLGTGFSEVRVPSPESRDMAESQSRAEVREGKILGGFSEEQKEVIRETAIKLAALFFPDWPAVQKDDLAKQLVARTRPATVFSVLFSRHSLALAVPFLALEALFLSVFSRGLPEIFVIGGVAVVGLTGLIAFIPTWVEFLRQETLGFIGSMYAESFLKTTLARPKFERTAIHEDIHLLAKRGKIKYDIPFASAFGTLAEISFDGPDRSGPAMTFLADKSFSALERWAGLLKKAGYSEKSGTEDPRSFFTSTRRGSEESAESRLLGELLAEMAYQLARDKWSGPEDAWEYLARLAQGEDPIGVEEELTRRASDQTHIGSVFVGAPSGVRGAGETEEKELTESLLVQEENRYKEQSEGLRSTTVTLVNAREGGIPVSLEIQRISREGGFWITVKIEGQRTGDIRLEWNGTHLKTDNMFPLGRMDPYGPGDTNKKYRGRGITDTILNWVAWEARQNGLRLRNTGTKRLDLLHLFHKYCGGEEARILRKGVPGEFFSEMVRKHGFYSCEIWDSCFLERMTSGRESEPLADLVLKRVGTSGNRYRILDYEYFLEAKASLPEMFNIGREIEIGSNGAVGGTPYILSSGMKEVGLEGPPTFSQVPRQLVARSEIRSIATRAHATRHMKPFSRIPSCGFVACGLVALEAQSAVRRAEMRLPAEEPVEEPEWGYEHLRSLTWDAKDFPYFMEYLRMTPAILGLLFRIRKFTDKTQLPDWRKDETPLQYFSKVIFMILLVGQNWRAQRDWERYRKLIQEKEATGWFYHGSTILAVADEVGKMLAQDPSRPVVIYVFGSAGGEEAYSLALILKYRHPDQTHRLKIIAADKVPQDVRELQFLNAQHVPDELKDMIPQYFNKVLQYDHSDWNDEPQSEVIHKLKEEFLDLVELQTLDVLKYHPEKESTDVILANGFLGGHIGKKDGLEGILRKFHEQLRSGGVIAVANKGFNHQADKETFMEAIHALVDDGFFEIVQEQGIDSGIYRKPVRSEVRAEKVRRLLTDPGLRTGDLQRPEPSWVKALSWEDIRAGAHLAYGNAEETDARMTAIRNSEMWQELENGLPYVEKFIDRLLELYPDRTFIMPGRDAEIFYDALSQKSLPKGKIRLFPAGHFLLEELRENTEYARRQKQIEPVVKEFLKVAGLTPSAVRRGEKFLLVDTGFRGSVLGALADLFYWISPSYEYSAKLKLDGTLFATWDTNLTRAVTLYADQLLSFNISADQLAHDFPRAYRKIPAEYRIKNSPQAANFTIATVLQLLPRYHGHFRSASLTPDQKLKIRCDAKDIQWNMDKIGPGDYDDDIVNPLAALMVQKRVLEYFSPMPTSEVAKPVRSEMREAERLAAELGFELQETSGVTGIRYPQDYKVPAWPIALIAVPHGTTYNNEKKVIHGRRTNNENSRVNDRGRTESERGAAALWERIGREWARNPEKYVFLVTPAFRTAETAEIFNRYFEKQSGKRFQTTVDPDAAEADFGLFDGMTAEEVGRRYGVEAAGLVRQYRAGDVTVRYTGGGENRLRILKRVRDWLQGTAAKYQGKAVILFGHGTFITALEVLQHTERVVTGAHQEVEFTQYHLERGLPLLIVQVSEAGKNAIRHGLSDLAKLAQSWVEKMSAWDDRSQKEAKRIDEKLQHELDKVKGLIHEHLQGLSPEDRRELIGKITDIENRKNLKRWANSHSRTLSDFRAMLGDRTARSEMRTDEHAERAKWHERVLDLLRDEKNPLNTGELLPQLMKEVRVNYNYGRPVKVLKPLSVNITVSMYESPDEALSVEQREQIRRQLEGLGEDDYFLMPIIFRHLDLGTEYAAHRVVVAKKAALSKALDPLDIGDVNVADEGILYLFRFEIHLKELPKKKGVGPEVFWTDIAYTKRLQNKKLMSRDFPFFAGWLIDHFPGASVYADLAHPASAVMFQKSFLNVKGSYDAGSATGYVAADRRQLPLLFPNATPHQPKDELEAGSEMRKDSADPTHTGSVFNIVPAKEDEGTQAVPEAAPALSHVRLSDEDVQEYFGSEVLAECKRTGKAFYLKPLMHEKDSAYIDAWKNENKQDRAWNKLWRRNLELEKPLSMRDSLYSEVPHFPLSKENNVGLVSIENGREKLEGFIGFELKKDEGSEANELYVQSIELYYKNISMKRMGYRAQLPRAADVLFDYLLKYFQEKLRAKGNWRAVTIKPLSEGGRAFSSRNSMQKMDHSRYLGISSDQIAVEYESRKLRRKFNTIQPEQEEGPQAAPKTAPESESKSKMVSRYLAAAGPADYKLPRSTWAEWWNAWKHRNGRWTHDVVFEAPYLTSTHVIHCKIDYLLLPLPGIYETYSSEHIKERPIDLMIAALGKHFSPGAYQDVNEDLMAIIDQYTKEYGASGWQIHWTNDPKLFMAANPELRVVTINAGVLLYSGAQDTEEYSDFKKHLRYNLAMVGQAIRGRERELRQQEEKRKNAEKTAVRDPGPAFKQRLGKVLLLSFGAVAGIALQVWGFLTTSVIAWIMNKNSVPSKPQVTSPVTDKPAQERVTKTIPKAKRSEMREAVTTTPLTTDALIEARTQLPGFYSKPSSYFSKVRMVDITPVLSPSQMKKGRLPGGFLFPKGLESETNFPMGIGIECVRAKMAMLLLEDGTWQFWFIGEKADGTASLGDEFILQKNAKESTRLGPYAFRPLRMLYARTDNFNTSMDITSLLTQDQLENGDLPAGLPFPNGQTSTSRFFTGVGKNCKRIEIILYHENGWWDFGFIGYREDGSVSYGNEWTATKEGITLNGPIQYRDLRALYAKTGGFVRPFPLQELLSPNQLEKGMLPADFPFLNGQTAGQNFLSGIPRDCKKLGLLIVRENGKLYLWFIGYKNKRDAGIGTEWELTAEGPVKTGPLKYRKVREFYLQAGETETRIEITSLMIKDGMLPSDMPLPLGHKAGQFYTGVGGDCKKVEVVLTRKGDGWDFGFIGQKEDGSDVFGNEWTATKEGVTLNGPLQYRELRALYARKDDFETSVYITSLLSQDQLMDGRLPGAFPLPEGQVVKRILITEVGKGIKEIKMILSRKNGRWSFGFVGYKEDGSVSYGNEHVANREGFTLVGSFEYHKVREFYSSAAAADRIEVTSHFTQKQLKEGTAPGGFEFPDGTRAGQSRGHFYTGIGPLDPGRGDKIWLERFDQDGAPKFRFAGLQNGVEKIGKTLPVAVVRSEVRETEEDLTESLLAKEEKRYREDLGHPEGTGITLANIREGGTPVSLKIRARRNEKFGITVAVGGRETGTIDLVRNGAYLETDFIIPIGNTTSDVNLEHRGRGIANTIFNWMAWEAQQNGLRLRNSGTQKLSLLHLLHRYFGGEKAQVVESGIAGEFFSERVREYGFFGEEIWGACRLGQSEQGKEEIKETSLSLKRSNGTKDQYRISKVKGSDTSRTFKENDEIEVSRDGRIAGTPYFLIHGSKAVRIEGPPSFSRVPRQVIVTSGPAARSEVREDFAQRATRNAQREDGSLTFARRRLPAAEGRVRSEMRLNPYSSTAQPASEEGRRAELRGRKPGSQNARPSEMGNRSVLWKKLNALYTKMRDLDFFEEELDLTPVLKPTPQLVKWTIPPDLPLPDGRKAGGRALAGSNFPMGISASCKKAGVVVIRDSGQWCLKFVGYKKDGEKEDGKTYKVTVNGLEPNIAPRPRYTANHKLITTNFEKPQTSPDPTTSQEKPSKKEGILSPGKVFLRNMYDQLARALKEKGFHPVGDPEHIYGTIMKLPASIGTIGISTSDSGTVDLHFARNASEGKTYIEKREGPFYQVIFSENYLKISKNSSRADNQKFVFEYAGDQNPLIAIGSDAAGRLYAIVRDEVLREYEEQGREPGDLPDLESLPILPISAQDPRAASLEILAKVENGRRMADGGRRETDGVEPEAPSSILPPQSLPDRQAGDSRSEIRESKFDHQLTRAIDGFRLTSAQIEEVRKKEDFIAGVFQKAVESVFPGKTIWVKALGSSARLTYVGDQPDFDICAHLDVAEHDLDDQIQEIFDQLRSGMAEEGYVLEPHVYTKDGFRKARHALNKMGVYYVLVTELKDLKTGAVFHSDLTIKIDQEKDEVRKGISDAYLNHILSEYAKLRSSGGEESVALLQANIRFMRYLLKSAGVELPMGRQKGGFVSVNAEQLVMQTGGFDAAMEFLVAFGTDGGRALSLAEAKQKKWPLRVITPAVDGDMLGWIDEAHWKDLIGLAIRYKELKEKGEFDLDLLLSARSEVGGTRTRDSGFENKEVGLGTRTSGLDRTKDESGSRGASDASRGEAGRSEMREAGTSHKATKPQGSVSRNAQRATHNVLSGPDSLSVARSTLSAAKMHVAGDPVADKSRRAELREKQTNSPVSGAVLLDRIPQPPELFSADDFLYALEIRQKVNPQGKPITAVYGGAGADISGALVMLDAKKNLFVSNYSDLKVEDLKWVADKLKVLEAHGDSALYSLVDRKHLWRYFNAKRVLGGAHSADVELSDYLKVSLLLELHEMKIYDIRVDGVFKTAVLWYPSVANGPKTEVPRMRFKWDYFGLYPEREYSILFVNADITDPSRWPEILKKQVGQGFDAFLLKRGYEIAKSYKTEGPENFIRTLHTGMPVGAWFVTDDHYISEGMTSKGNISGITDDDASSRFPLEKDQYREADLPQNDARKKLSVSQRYGRLLRLRQVTKSAGPEEAADGSRRSEVREVKTGMRDSGLGSEKSGFGTRTSGLEKAENSTESLVTNPEERGEAVRSKARVQPVASVVNKAVLVIEQARIDAMTPEDFKMLLTLAGTRRSEIRLVIPDAVQGQYSARVVALRSVAAIDFRLPETAWGGKVPVFGFSDMNNDSAEAFKDRLGKMDPRLARRFTDCFALEGVDGIVLALLVDQPKDLQLKNGFRYDGSGRFLSTVHAFVDTLIQNYVVISTAA